MKLISTTSLVGLKEQAEKEINEHFNEVTRIDQWRSLAHSIKQVTAQSILNGAEAPQEFQDAAALEKMSVPDYAALIVSKANQVMQIENERRRLILATRAANSGPELTAIKSELKVYHNG